MQVLEPENGEEDTAVVVTDDYKTQKEDLDDEEMEVSFLFLGPLCVQSATKALLAGVSKLEDKH